MRLLHAMSGERTRCVVTIAALVIVMVAHRNGAFDGLLLGRGLESAANNGPNQTEQDLITKNYYEQLVRVEREPEWRLTTATKALLGMGGAEPGEDDDSASIAVYGATEDLAEGFLEHRFKPYWSGRHCGVTVATNRWGHRDDDTYDKRKPPGVFRIALVGSSNLMGTGVEREEGLELLIESRLNAEWGGKGHERYEIINFSVPRYHLLERVYVAETVAPEFEPDLIIVGTTMRDLRRALYDSVARRVHDRRDLHFPFLKEIVRRAHVKPEFSETKLQQRLQRFAHEIAAGAMSHLAQFSRSSGIPVAVLVLRLEADGVHDNHEWIARTAAAQGLVTLRIYNAYEGRSAEEVYRIPGRDFHPTALGHRLLASEIYGEMLADPVIGPLLRADVRSASGPEAGR